VRKRERRGVDIFNLSFLDVVSCGFGAIILLLVIVKIAEPTVIKKLSVDLTSHVEALAAEAPELRTRAAALEQELEQKRAHLARTKQELARLAGELSSVRGQYATTKNEHAAQTIIENSLESARQSLTEEMRRLLGAGFRRSSADATIGGIPVDSEYVIFIIDTSGSMNQNAWPLVLKKVSEVLQIYPTVKGIQVMNDMGQYMFTQYAGRWIPDSAARRGAITTRLAGWMPFSNSSPVEGIEAAIRRFYAKDRRISLYIFGDDFARGSIQSVIDTVDSINRADSSGGRRVRIHAVGFPVLFDFAGRGIPASVVRFAALMRKLAENNNGSFVGLNSVKP
jgi:hypothetical protein